MASNTNPTEQQQVPATPANTGGTLYQPTPTAAPRPLAPAASTATPAPVAASNVQPTLNTIQANLSNLLKTPASATHSAQIAAALAPHMTQIMNLAKQGTLTESQMAQLKTLAGIVAPGGQQAAAAASTPRPAGTAPPRPAGTPQPTTAPAVTAQTAAKPATTTSATTYPATTQQSWSRPVPVLSGQLLPQYAATAPTYATTAATSPAPVPRRALKDLVYGFESDVRVDPDAEQFLLQAADDFIESVTQFACRVAKHRALYHFAPKLELVTEKNYDLHIPGFATDETRHANATAAQASVTNAISKPIAPLPAARKSRHRATDPATLRASRLAAVRDAASRPT
ncbi:Transcription initiation factor TFIID subunit 12 [Ceratobasidium sp. 423]|nr:Transcription initiation factor TFIID subunit 12 [Ceratobasidium sp. 423]